MATVVPKPSRTRGLLMRALSVCNRMPVRKLVLSTGEPAGKQLLCKISPGSPTFCALNGSFLLPREDQDSHWADTQH